MLLVLAAIIGCMGWLFTGVFGLYLSRSIKSINNIPDFPELDCLPSLSVVIAVRNEEQSLAPALASLISVDYPGLQIIYVNDRSTDATGQMLKQAAARHSHITLIDMKTLPEGWLGKVHALHQGVQKATGEWILLSDADVIFDPDLFQKAIIFAKKHKLSHLTMGPRILAEDFWHKATLCAFGGLFMLHLRPKALLNPRSKAFTGVGAFNLIEGNVYKASPGLPWLRMDVVDDMGIGLIMKMAGARSMLIRGDGQLSVPWYESLGAMVRGLEKNLFGAACAYSYLRLCFFLLVFVFLTLSPWVALLQPWSMMGKAFGLAAIVANTVYNLTMAGMFQMPITAALAAPLGSFIFVFILLRSAYKTWRQGGIRWRDTFYSIHELRKGRRVRL